MSPKIVALATIGVFIGSLIVVTFVYFTSRVGGESGPDWLYVIPFMFAFSGIVVWFMTVTNVFVIKNEPREYAKLAVLVIGIVLMSGSTIENLASPLPERQTLEIQPIKVELDDVSILQISERSATIEVKFKLTNPNPSSVIVSLVIGFNP